MNRMTYLGTAAAMTFGLGAVPKNVNIYNLATGLAPFRWNEGMLANSAVAGGVIDVAGTYTPRTVLTGLQIYFGGDVVSASSSSVVVPYTLNSALNINYAGGIKVGGPKLFTMDTAANGTGHTDVALPSGTGAGSVIVLEYRDARGNFAQWTGRIAALASDGTNANNITLTPQAPNISGATVVSPSGGAYIVYLGPQYDMVAAPAGQIMPAGVKLIDTTYQTAAVQWLIEWE